MSVAEFTDEANDGGCGHGFPMLDSGHDFSLLDGGHGFTLYDDDGGSGPHSFEAKDFVSHLVEEEVNPLVRGADVDLDLDNDIERGSPMVEVYSVVIENNKSRDGLSLYGTIRIDDGYKPEYIYNNTNRDDSEYISPGDSTTLLLTGLSRPFSVLGPLWIDFSLRDNNDDVDDVFYKRMFSWHYSTGHFCTYDDDDIDGEITTLARYYPSQLKFDQPLTFTLEGRSGSVTINYIMLTEGVAAYVEVALLDHVGGDGAAAHVHGLIQAGSNCDNFTYTCVLFNNKKKNKKENDDYIDVRPGQLIPLSRSLVVVDGYSSLNVLAKLYDRRCRHGTYLSEDDEIVNGSVDFPAQTKGTSEKNISGQNGEIRVKVTWSVQ